MLVAEANGFPQRKVTQMKPLSRPRIGPAALVVALLAAALPAAADVSLPHIFGSHMVLQREQEVPVWGQAAPGEKVSVRLGNRPAAATTADANGRWRVDLPAMPAGGPFTLTVTGNNTVTCEDVLVGEVWLCSGQSNMEWVVANSLNPEQEIAAANFPQIRHIKVPRTAASIPANDFEGAWQVCSPETVGAFSACAYFMGRYLHQELGVPVGMINSSWSGTRIEPWIPPVGFEPLPVLAPIHRLALLADPRSAQHKEALNDYLRQLETWAKGTRAAMAKDGSPTPSPTFPIGLLPLTNRGQPTTLYNGMIHPLIPFAFRGAIWYQGESNHNEGMLYTEKMKALVGGWRRLWNREFPFLYVQIAPYQYNNENPSIVPEFWEAQSAALSIPNTGMVVINDIGEVTNIHPRNKQEVGRRLGLLALAKAYGRRDLACDGPTFQSLAMEGNRLRVRFTNTAGGLAARDGKPLTWFEIIGKEGEWVKADAVIDGDSVLLSSPAVPQPVAMRFAWHRNAEPNLMNKAGLPASAFRAGQPPVHDLLAEHVPEAKEYQLVYALDLAKLGPEIVYDVDRRAQIIQPFDRVAYFLELQKENAPAQWIYVSMDAFTNDLGQIGVPTAASKAFFQRKVANLNVFSNVPEIVTGTGLKGGNIEFWPHNYSGPNSAGIPNASGELWDFGDQIGPPVDGYGSMQVHNYEAQQTLFAINSWKQRARADVGIGNSDAVTRARKTRDWTFAANANSYKVKKLRVLVRPKNN